MPQFIIRLTSWGKRGYDPEPASCHWYVENGLPVVPVDSGMVASHLTKDQVIAFLSTDLGKYRKVVVISR